MRATLAIACLLLSRVAVATVFVHVPMDDLTRDSEAVA
jgi:hypothetical protein